MINEIKYPANRNFWTAEENGQVYESKINANVYSPTVYPAGWSLIE